MQVMGLIRHNMRAADNMGSPEPKWLGTAGDEEENVERGDRMECYRIMNFSVVSPWRRI